MSSFEAEAEEQLMESEALESIYVDDFEQVSASPFHWKVSIQPYSAGDGEENHVGIVLEAKLPAAYPNEVPELEVVVTKGLGDEQREALLALAKEKAEENLGMAMIYTIADELKEWLAAHNEPMQDNSMFAKMQRRMHEKASPAASDSGGGSGGPEPAMSEAQSRELEALERNKQKVLEGTPVTPESFAAWKAKFEAEAATVAVEAAADEISSRQSGREYFLANVDVESWEEPAEGDDEGGEGGGGAAEAGEDDLFGGDDDLDDLSDEDDEDEED